MITKLLTREVINITRCVHSLCRHYYVSKS